MRKTKRYNYLLFIVYPLFFLLAMSLVKVHPYIIQDLFHYANWVALAVCLGMILTPIGKKRLASADSPEPMLSTKRWWLYIITMELGIVLFILGLHQFVFHAFPVAQKPISLTTTFNTLFYQYALYPFAILALLASYYGYIAFNLQKDAFIARMPQSLFKFKDTSMLANLYQVTVRNGTTMFFAIIFAVMAMWAASLYAIDHPTLLPKGLHNRAFFTAIIIIIIVFLPPVKRLIAKLFKRQLPALFGFAAMALLLGLLILFFGVLFSAVHDTAAKAGQYKFLHLIQHFGAYDIWTITLSSILLALTPLCAVFIGYHSKGRSIRECIIAILLPIAMFALIFYGVVDYGHHSLTLPNWALNALSAIGLIILITTLCKRKTQGMMVLTMINKNGRLKYRDHHLLYRRAFRLAAAIVYLYLPSGLPYVMLMCVLAVLPLYVLIVLCIIGMSKALAN